MLARSDDVTFAFQNLRERLDWAKCFNHTPDTHRLRYAGPQLVFVWGDNQLATVLNPQLDRFGIKPNDNFRTVAAVAETKISFIQMKNISEDRDRCFKLEDILCFDNTVVKAKMKDDKPQALPIRGRVLKCDLRTLQALDRMFSNKDKTNRIQLTVKATTMDEEYKVWVYTNRSHLLFAQGDNTFSDGVFLRPYPVTHRGDHKFYGTWGGH